MNHDGRSWAGRWDRRLNEILHEQGYSDVSRFAERHPDCTFEELASVLGNEVAPVQIEQLLRRHYLQNGDVTTFAKDALNRYLREYLPDGWGDDETSKVLAAQAFGAWSGALGEEYDDITDIVWDRLEAQSIPKGWLPAVSGDRILNEAFKGISFQSGSIST